MWSCVLFGEGAEGGAFGLGVHVIVGAWPRARRSATTAPAVLSASFSSFACGSVVGHNRLAVNAPDGESDGEQSFLV